MLSGKRKIRDAVWGVESSERVWDWRATVDPQ